MRVYLKCWYYNRFSFFGTLIFWLSVGTLVLNARVGGLLIFIVIGGPTLAIVATTGFGLHTYETYCRAMEHRNKYGDIEEWFADAYDLFYCDRVGVELARKASS